MTSSGGPGIKYQGTGTEGQVLGEDWRLSKGSSKA